MCQQKIEHVIEIIQSGITSMNGEELESINVTRIGKNEANKKRSFNYAR